MKNIIFLFSIVLLVASCNSPSGEKADVNEAQTLDSVSESAASYAVKTSESHINWTGTKPTGEHYGIVALESGEILVENGEIAGGSVQIDMNSIRVDDIKKVEMKAKLTTHLKSSDFFHTDSFPVARFTLASVVPLSGESQAAEGKIAPTHKVTGNLKIKDTEKSVSFPAKISVSEKEITAQSVAFTIDRTEWGIVYKSGSVFENLADKAIHDDIQLKISLKASR